MKKSDNLGDSYALSEWNQHEQSSEFDVHILVPTLYDVHVIVCLCIGIPKQKYILHKV